MLCQGCEKKVGSSGVVIGSKYEKVYIAQQHKNDNVFNLS